MTTNTNDFAGAVLLLTDPANAEEQAERVVSGYFPESAYHFTVTESTPTSLPADTQARINGLQASLPYETAVLTVYPWAVTENNLPGRPTIG